MNIIIGALLSVGVFMNQSVVSDEQLDILDKLAAKFINCAVITDNPIGLSMAKALMDLNPDKKYTALLRKVNLMVSVVDFGVNRPNIIQWWQCREMITDEKGYIPLIKEEFENNNVKYPILHIEGDK